MRCGASGTTSRRTGRPETTSARCSPITGPTAGLPEFELIDRYLAAAGAARRDVAVGIGDDAAVLCVPPGALLESAAAVAVGADADDPAACARTLLETCEAALGGRGVAGRWATLALTLPAGDPAWVEPFAACLGALLRERSIALIGGDTTAGPRAVSLVLHGVAEPPPGVSAR